MCLLKGGAHTLESISPDELELNIFSVDSLGHIGVKGFTGHNVFLENISFRHCVQFGFEFDPSQLISTVKECWKKRIAKINNDAEQGFCSGRKKPRR